MAEGQSCDSVAWDSASGKDGRHGPLPLAETESADEEDPAVVAADEVMVNWSVDMFLYVCVSYLLNYRLRDG